MPDVSSIEAPFDHGLRRQSVVRAMLTDIFHGKLRAGQRLVTESLATRFRVSHTPIREALIELRGLGVVELLPNRGAVVRKITAQSVREVCQVRKVLECEAIRGAVRMIDHKQVTRLAAETRELAAMPTNATAVTKAQEIDSQLHDAIYAACGNVFLAAELERLRTLFRTFRDVTWDLEVARSEYHRIAIEATEHLAITDALLAGDARAASAAMTTHMRSGQLYWVRVTTNLKNLPTEP